MPSVENPLGGEIANFSIATDESYTDRNTGQKVDQTEWHRCVSFQEGLVNVLESYGKKGRLVYVSGKIQTRKWVDKDGGNRYSTEIVIIPGGRVQFLDRDPSLNGHNAGAQNVNQEGGAPATSGVPHADDDIPF